MTATILVIDDSEDDQRLYRRALKGVDCRLVMASTAKDGLICLADLKPDLILLDYNLPDLSGLELVKMFAECSGTAPPVIMLTGEGSESLAVEVIQSGADDYLVKDTAGQYLRLLPGVIERAMAFHAQREQNQRLLYETARLLHRNRILMQNSADGIHVMDRQGNIVEANDAFRRMLGYSQEEVTHLNMADWDAQWPAGGLPEGIEDHVCKCGMKETAYRRKDGTLIDVETSCSCTEVDGQAFLFISSRDITGRKRAERALREADRHKDEFLAMLAHELRNPLAPIRNAVHVLGLMELAEPRVRWAQEIIERQVNHLARLVDDLLDASRIARGKIILKRETIEFAVLAEHVIQSARLLAENKGHRLAVRLPDQAVQLDGDPVRLSQLLLNLLDNAVKYTPDGGQIEFAARLDGQEIEISVRDNGMGITAELLPRVFDLFQQDERKLDRANGGLGIGLTLVQHLAGMHGGWVEAYSAGPGLGSTFTVRLPAKAMPTPLSRPETESRSSPAVGMRVLVVEDDHAVADSTAVLLEMEGHQARIADSGPAALELIAEFRPQVVLLDIGLKGMDGFETAKRLRQLPEGRDLFMVAVTGYADSAIKAQALDSGCDHFLVKPVTFKDISSLLDKLSVPD